MAIQPYRVATLAQAAFLKALAYVSRLASDDHMYDGGWSGNDTIPRTTLDLNNALYFYRQDRTAFSDVPVRRVLNIVDGVIAGEGYGPLWPTAKPAGIVIGGWNPLAIDTLGAMVIGYDPMKVRLLRYGFEHPKSLLARMSPGSRRPRGESGWRQAANGAHAIDVVCLARRMERCFYLRELGDNGCTACI